MQATGSDSLEKHLACLHDALEMMSQGARYYQITPNKITQLTDLATKMADRLELESCEPMNISDSQAKTELTALCDIKEGNTFSDKSQANKLKKTADMLHRTKEILQELCT